MSINEVMKIRQSSRQIAQELGTIDNLFSEIGSYSQCHALIALKQSKYLSGAQLSKLLNLEKSSISRLIKNLQDKNYCKIQQDPSDSRAKLITLTKKGKNATEYINSVANQQVSDALAQLNESERKQVISGMYLYAKALKKSRIQSQYTIRRLQKTDGPTMIKITKNVWTEFGFDANHPNSNIYEKELNEMMDKYMDKQSHYYVIVFDGVVVGGGGFRPVGAAKDQTCELQSMYFLPETRGLGLGSMLLKYLLNKATRSGYKQVYLETMNFMHRANALYNNSGFVQLKKPRFNTGHVWTNCWYLKEL